MNGEIRIPGYVPASEEAEPNGASGRVKSDRIPAEKRTESSRESGSGYPCRLGLLLGRFQGFHIGHEAVLRHALSLCERVLVQIGSSDKSGTEENPFPYALRRDMIAAVFAEEAASGRLIIAPLPDLGVGNVPRWGDYVMENAIRSAGMPDCVLYGMESKCETWFAHFPGLRYERVDRDTIHVHGTDLRRMLREDRKEEFFRFSSPRLHALYPQLRACVLAAGTIMR